VDGTAIEGNAFTLNSDVTVSGEFTYTGSDPVYTVTITQSEGGTITASPLSGPAGTAITLTNTPNDGWTLARCTVDGSPIEGNTFTLNKNVTVSGEFTPAGSLKLTIRYGLGDNGQGSFSDLPLDIPAAGPVSITIENYTDFDGYALDYITLTDYENSQTSYKSLPAWVKDRIAAEGITIRLRSNSASVIDVSLRNIHLLRMAFNDQNLPVTNEPPMDKIFIDMPKDKFIPVLDAQDWAYYHYYRITWETGEEKSFYDFYPKTSTELINGLTIQPDGNPADNKYKIVVGRALKVTNLFYSWDRPALLDNEEWYTGKQTPINGFGWEINAGGSIVLATPDESVYVGEYYWFDRNLTFANYEAALRNNGFHPSNGVFLNHSEVYLMTDSANTNVMSNGIYDFILAYYNPDKDYNAAAYEVKDEYNRITYTDGRARLPSWPSSGLTFDGSQNGVSSRNIGGITAASAARKASVDGGGYQKGEPRSDFVGNITVPMANYMVSSLHINAFKNTNIIGDGDMWDNLGNIMGSNLKSLILISTVNIGIIGDYSSIEGMSGNFRGLTDIKGIAPIGIGQGGRTGYFNIWDNVSRETLQFANISVVRIHGTGGHKVGTDIYEEGTKTFVVIYDKKYTDNLDSNVYNMHPYHRAFVDSSGQIRVVDPEMTGIDGKYKGSNKNQSIPSLNEEDWITAGNSGLDKPTADLSSTYASLSSAYKWNDAADFNSNSVSAAPAPAPSGVRLAGGVRPEIEAVLPAKKKSRFEEAFLAALWKDNERMI
jgi:hypothetical protein